MKLHLGCGKRNFGEDWFHIDGNKSYEHVKWFNITKLPFEDSVVDLIYASHVIEYFDREEIIPVLNEWKRVLKPGGILRLAVPDFEKLGTVYEITEDLNLILGPLYGKMQMGDKIIYHKTVYDFNLLENLLEEIGFKNIERYNWRYTEHSQFDDHSQAYMLPKGDKENGLLISLNINAIK